MLLHTLHGKLSAVLLGLLLLIGLLAVPLTIWTTQRYQEEISQQLNRTLAHDMASETPLLDNGRVRHKSLKTLFSQLMAINPNVEVYLLDPTGEILAFSAPPGKVKRKTVGLAPIRHFLQPRATLPIQGDDPRDVHRRKIFSAWPLHTPAGELDGYLYVILSGEARDSLDRRLQPSYILRVAFWTIAGGLSLVLIAGLLLFRLLTRRLRRLTRAVETFAAHDFADPDFAPPPPHGAHDEIDRLTLVTTQMGARIQDQLGALREADARRRELIGNVSHDLRTPLTALHGYLETLHMKEETLTRAEQRAYLATALRHSERLGKLTAELFDLARLDIGEMQPQAESFSLAELAQDVAQKFALSAEQRQIHLETHFAPGAGFVHADIGMIERVLENLMENALRHTPADGSITLTVGAPQNGRVALSVADTGPGIPPEDIPHIFDRFFRGDAQSSESGSVDRSEGAGLGLAIAQRIVERHGDRLEVHSAPGSGAVFMFRLPVSSPALTDSASSAS